MGENPQPGSRRKIKAFFLNGLALLAGLGLVVGLVLWAGFGEFWEVIRRTSLSLTVSAVCVFAVCWFFRTWRIKLLADRTGVRIKSLELFELHIAGYGLNSFLPGKLGDLATVGFLRMRGIPIGWSVALVAWTRALDALAVTLMSIPPVFLVFGAGTPKIVRTAILFCLMALLFVVGFVFLDRKRKLLSLLERLHSRLRKRFLRFIISKLGDAYEAYTIFVRDIGSALTALLLSLCVWFLEGVVCFILARAVEVSISIPLAVLAVAMGNIGKSLLLTPGGWGLYEGALTGLLTAAGVPFSSAVAVGLLDHTLKKAFNILLGLPASTRQGVKLKEAWRLYGWRNDSNAGEREKTL